MALNASSVSNEIISEILQRQGLDSNGNIISTMTFLSKRDINDIIANKVSSHIISSLELNGSYTGVVPNGSPDPNNGSFVLSVIGVPLTGTVMELKSEYSGQQSSSGVPRNDWITGIVNALKGTTFYLTNGTITLSSTNTFLSALQSPEFITNEDFKGNIRKLITVLFEAIKNCTATPAVSATTSASGMGQSQLLTFE